MEKRYVKMDGAYRAIRPARTLYAQRITRVVVGAIVTIGFCAIFGCVLYGFFALGMIGE